MIHSDPRRTVMIAAQERGLSLASLSCMIGCDPAFLDSYVEGSGPRRLPEFERRALAITLDLDERKLGALESSIPAVR